MDFSEEKAAELLQKLESRFKANPERHKGISWFAVFDRLSAEPSKLWALSEMERTGGEPDVIGTDASTGEYIFCDCSKETPEGRRSLCYDREALESRKKFPPENSAIEMAAQMGVSLLDEEEYRYLQTLGHFDAKTSSWIQTPADIRKLGGALFADYRYGKVFVYHNSADSYYAARGFRGLLKV